MQYNVLNYLKHSYHNFGDKNAVVDTQKSYTFMEIAHTAYGLGEKIKASINQKTNQPIAILLPKTSDCIMSFIGVLFSGNIYVPLDVKSPSIRLKKILDNLGTPLIITNTQYLNQHKNILQNYPCLNLDEHQIEPYHTIDWSINVLDSDPVYIIHTSGSTGTPKGVVITHKNLIDYIDCLNDTFKLDHTHKIGSQSPTYFDNSTFDIYIMMSKGATMFIVPEMYYAFPVKLIDFFNKNKITTALWVPTVYGNFEKLNALDTKKFLYLQKMFSAGEKLLPHHVNYWIENQPNTQYFNLYGPTEITATCIYHEIKEHVTELSVPIGRAYNNIEALIINENMTLCDINEIGELYIRGTCLSSGYWNDKQKTDEVFVQNPLHSNYVDLVYKTGDLAKFNENKEILFIGRKDSQIKHKGHRIELGEIESAVLTHEDIDICCVTYNESTQAIVLHYESLKVIDYTELEQHLVQHIPKYMLPSQVNHEENIKRNKNGKIDRKYYSNL